MRTLSITAFVLIVNISNVFCDAKSDLARKEADSALLYLNQVQQLLNSIKSAADIKEHMDDINLLRRTFAKAVNVSNMAKLRWNTDLAAKGAKLDCKEESGPKFRSFKFHQKAVAVSDLSLSLLFMKMTPKDFNGLIFEMLSPHQYQLGCAKKSCPNDKYKEIEAKEHPDFEFICVLGPSSIWIVDAKVRGTPGSDCGKGVNDDGLCDMEPGKSESAAGTPAPKASEAPRASSEALSSNQTVTGSSTDHFIDSALLIPSIYLLF